MLRNVHTLAGISLCMLCIWICHSIVSRYNRIDVLVMTTLQKRNFSQPLALDPDNWQTVQDSVSYVYSSHLDLQSNDTHSWIVILGALRRDEMMDLFNENTTRYYYCRLWYVSLDHQINDVITSRVLDIDRSKNDEHTQTDSE